MVKKCGVEVMRPESHKPSGVPGGLPLVEEWKVPCQSQMTESFTEIETVEGLKVSVKPGPTWTVVVAAGEFCATATENNAVARITIVVLRWAFTRFKRGYRRVCSQNLKDFSVEFAGSAPIFWRVRAGSETGAPEWAAVSGRVIPQQRVRNRFNPGPS